MPELPLFLTEQTEVAIRSRLLNAVPADYDKSPGSVLHDLLAAVAIELAQGSDWAQQVLERTFASTTFGKYLDLRVGEHGLIRRPAVAARGMVTFSGAAGTLIPVGTTVSTASTPASPPALFATDVSASISGAGTVDVPITAAKAGATANVAAGTIVFVTVPIPGVTGVTNPTPIIGGLDEEDDASLLGRYLQKVREPSAGGNVADYVNWAMEVPGVGGVSVIPVRDGPGTVSIAIIDSQKQPASANLVTAVQQHIAPDGALGGGRAPIGALATVVAATARAINVTATLSIAQGYNVTSVRAAVTDSIRSYLRGLAFKLDNDVRYVRIGQTILDTPGILDYSGLAINGGTGNVVIGQQEVAILGTVTLT